MILMYLIVLMSTDVCKNTGYLNKSIFYSFEGVICTVQSIWNSICEMATSL